MANKPASKNRTKNPRKMNSTFNDLLNADLNTSRREKQ